MSTVKNKMGKVLLVGGTGYLGRKVFSRLIDNGYEVTCTYIDGEDYQSIIGTNSGACFISCNMSDIEKELSRNNYKWVMNFAALYEKKNTRLTDIVNVNAVLGIQLLSLACEYHIKNFLTTDTSLPETLNTYSFTKKKVAEFGKYMSKKYGINFMNIQPEMFYGEDEPDNRFISMCINKMMENEKLKLTEGKQIRDIIHISDVTEIIMKIIDKEPEGYNDIPIGTGEGVSIREIVNYIHQYIDSKSELEFGAIESRKDEPDCIANVKNLFSIIGNYKYKYNWKSGLAVAIKEKIG